MTTGSAHGLSIGAVIDIQGAVPAGYNGIFTVATVPSTTTLTFCESRRLSARNDVIGVAQPIPATSRTQLAMRLLTAK